MLGQIRIETLAIDKQNKAHLTMLKQNKTEKQVDDVENLIQ
jgi:hypothetical protein